MDFIGSKFTLEVSTDQYLQCTIYTAFQYQYLQQQYQSKVKSILKSVLCLFLCVFTVFVYEMVIITAGALV